MTAANETYHKNQDFSKYFTVITQSEYRGFFGMEMFHKHKLSIRESRVSLPSNCLRQSFWEPFRMFSQCIGSIQWSYFFPQKLAVFSQFGNVSRKLLLR